MFEIELESPWRILILKKAQRRDCLRSQAMSYHMADFGPHPLMNSPQDLYAESVQEAQEDKMLPPAGATGLSYKNLLLGKGKISEHNFPPILYAEFCKDLSGACIHFFSVLDWLRPRSKTQA